MWAFKPEDPVTVQHLFDTTHDKNKHQPRSRNHNLNLHDSLTIIGIRR